MPTQSASIKKCCPLHQTFKYEHGRKECADKNDSKFNVKAIFARFYENCIEDVEFDVNISVKIENNCKRYEIVLGIFCNSTQFLHCCN